ncbi:MAG: GTPase Era [Oscillospiraceae bacterium]|nr:GTPase Era [Oscillospiraceae bacterium]MBQ9939409.1 GTPase Era [Oscillospiraceae bacterium]
MNDINNTLESASRSVFVAIVGRPNVGKSTLINSLVGEKIAIVSDKPQTTRNRIIGIVTKDDLQFVFIDTPGLHKPRTKLNEYMIKQVGDSVADVDVAVLVTEPTGDIAPAEKELIANFEKLGLPAVLAVNKIDALSKKEDMLEKIAVFSEAFEFDEILPISAKTGDGVEMLMDIIERYSAEGPHFFPDDAFTDQPERVIAAEIIREKLLLSLDKEVPHGTAVTIESMKEREDAEILDIDAVICCEKDSHKGIIIGKGGAKLKAVATDARIDMEAFFGIKVNLQCWVKVKEDWRNREGMMRNFGYV